MKSVPCLTLAIALALPGRVRADDEPTLDLGIQQVRDGDLSKAVLTLDAVILRLTPNAAARSKELAQAHLYKGIALVGQGQEAAAKAAFREALARDPTLRLKKGEQPDRVVRVFDAAREGKTKSVMERPNEAPKKVGLGAGAVAAIVGGVALAGGAAVAVAGGDSAPTPAPSPTPSPLTTSVSPTSGVGKGQFAYVNAAPGPGSRLSGCGTTGSGCDITVVFTVTVQDEFSSGKDGLAWRLRAEMLAGPSAICLRGETVPVDISPSDGTFAFQVVLKSTGTCQTPILVDRMRVCIGDPRLPFCHGDDRIPMQTFSVSYQLDR